jgi:hypothetical protein
MTKSTGSPVGLRKIINNLELALHNRHEDHLGDTIPRSDLENLVSPIPARNHYLTLVVAIN